MSSTPTEPTTPDPELPETFDDSVEPAGVLLEDPPYGEAYLEHTDPVDEGPGILARMGAEALGAFGLVLAGVGVAIYASFNGAGVLGVALAFGLSLFVLIAAFGWISGGHYNPAVTL